MNTLIQLLSTLVLIGFIACSSSSEKAQEKKQSPEAETNPSLLLNPLYEEVNQIVAKANCQGPSGKYHSEVHTSKDGYVFFFQDYTYRNAVFKAVLLNLAEGYTLDEENQLADTLNAPMLEFIKGHTFHDMGMYPERYFDNLTFAGEESYQGQEVEKYTGRDAIDNPVEIFYKRANKRIQGVKIRNPFEGKSEEVLEFMYSDWQNSEFGDIAQKVKIIQAAKDTFFFDYYAININPVGFKKLDF